MMNNLDITNVTSFEGVVYDMVNQHTGQSFIGDFHATINEEGLTASKDILGDYFKHFSELIKLENRCGTRVMRTTLLKLAGFAVATVVWMDEDKDCSDYISRFKGITHEMITLYAKKNRDYGNSFDESLDEDGLLVSKIRLGDKFKRFSQLINNEALVKDESIRDTLVDMANYAIMTVMWMDNQKGVNPENFIFNGREDIFQVTEDEILQWIKEEK